MAELVDWQGELAGRRGEHATITATAILRDAPSPAGAKPVLVRADDGQRYWLKAISNPQGANVPVAEQVVARCGELIGAPVRPVQLVVIPEDLAGYTIYPGHILKAGTAHGSLDLAAAQLTWSLDHAERDENRFRYLAIAALFDWCWGDDTQWLYQSGAEADYEYYSHDHGEYLLGQSGWAPDTLLDHVDEPHPLSIGPALSSLAGFSELADRIAAVTHEQLVGVLATIPLSWQVSDAQLEAIGYFLECRRDAVAKRVRDSYLIQHI